MIQSVNNKNIKECVDVIKASFLTVANEFGFTIENAPRFTAFATTEQRLSWQLNNEKRPMYAFIVDGKIVTSGDYTLIEKVDREGYKWIEKEFGVSINKEHNSKVMLGTCNVKESVSNG